MTQISKASWQSCSQKKHFASCVPDFGACVFRDRSMKLTKRQPPERLNRRTILIRLPPWGLSDLGRENITSLLDVSTQWNFGKAPRQTIVGETFPQVHSNVIQKPLPVFHKAERKHLRRLRHWGHSGRSGVWSQLTTVDDRQSGTDSHWLNPPVLSVSSWNSSMTLVWKGVNGLRNLRNGCKCPSKRRNFRSVWPASSAFPPTKVNEKKMSRQMVSEMSRSQMSWKTPRKVRAETVRHRYAYQGLIKNEWHWSSRNEPPTVLEQMFTVLYGCNWIRCNNGRLAGVGGGKRKSVQTWDDHWFSCRRLSS